MRFSFQIALSLIAFVAPHHARAEDRIDVAGAGSDVILIPDLGADGRALQSIADSLSRCHRTHSFTLAGLAGQPADDNTSSDAWIESIDRYIGKLEPQKAVVIGHGLGGVLALKLALVHPERVERLIVLDTLPYPAALAPAESVTVRAQDTRTRMIGEPVDAFRSSQTERLSTLTNHAERVPALVEWSLASDRRVLANAYYEWLTTDLREDLANIKTPTLVLVPWDVSQPQDTATTLDRYRKQYAPLASAQVKLIKGSRHYLTFDQPIFTNWAIEEFLDKCSG